MKIKLVSDAEELQLRTLRRSARASELSLDVFSLRHEAQCEEEELHRRIYLPDSLDDVPSAPTSDTMQPGESRAD